MAKRVKIGDIIQILSSEGVSYAQYTHKHPEYGYMITVFPGFYPKTPKDFVEVVNTPPQFHTFIALQSAINAGLFSIVANVPVAPHNQKFPIFRTCHYTKEGKKVNWVMWDGENSYKLENYLNDEQKKYSMRGIISAPLLIERIEKGYRPETHDL